ncbi:BgTH12-07002 [Blumeria graminis f. sp. triticale]|uniref:Bgt-1073 n=3 Tax=Blumeria graminis TaxID=34373 RepID=A0A9X9MP22_BLUGR|nr:BgTH12-07002 [Blumeria graminis f. sp. triticale]VDB94731.1 Bgt-1073 [Blumeria graminis f. sp. tritici]
METEYLSSQVSRIIEQLRNLFDEIGVPSHERETRELELFTALSETLNSHVRKVTTEKNTLTEEAQRIITTIKQMEASLEDDKISSRNHETDHIKVTYPLTLCLKGLKEKHSVISKLHRERFDQVKKLVQTLESYSSHLESDFVKITLPPTSSNALIPPTFDLSPTYIVALNNEFTRVHEEYNLRVSTVKAVAENIIHLWAELGTPQSQTDGNIVKYYRDSPEKIGLLLDNLNRLKKMQGKLEDEKKIREGRLRELKSSVESLWEKLTIPTHERKNFLNNNRGYGVRQINKYEEEFRRLNELKMQNLPLFIDDARNRLQVLWDNLYYSEEDMLKFTPAFSDVYSDALLEAHEQEIKKLEDLNDQWAPILLLVNKHRGLVKDRDELQTSSQDASRLLGRGQKGEKRDPTRLLREEKMRKRIAKDLPKIAIDLKRELERWEQEYGRPFLVYGEPYLDSLEETNPTPGPRSKTPAGISFSTTKFKNDGLSTKPNYSVKAPTFSSSLRIGVKTPIPNNGMTRNTFNSSMLKSPSKIPARAPLSNLRGGSSPERTSRPRSVLQESKVNMGPPPKMREIITRSPVHNHKYRSESESSNESVRQVTPEDLFYEGARLRSVDYFKSKSNYEAKKHMLHSGQEVNSDMYIPRQISSSTATTVSGSENWQTIEDDSEPEEDATSTYYSKLRAAQGKRSSPSNQIFLGQQKKFKGIVALPPPFESMERNSSHTALEYHNERMNMYTRT